MAYIQCCFFSRTLMRNTSVNVIIPTIDSDEALKDNPYDYFNPKTRYQTLYLLPSKYGDQTEWQRYSTIEQYALMYKLAVVMPAFDASVCEDGTLPENWEQFITIELREYLQKVFPLSRRRENTFIAGVAQGACGALDCAMKRPDLYACCAAVSMPHIEIPDQESVVTPVSKIAFYCSAKEESDWADHAVRKLKERGMDAAKKLFEGKSDWHGWNGCLQEMVQWMPICNELIEEEM